ncbi:hypothetical protein STRDD11_02314 [Streptococcus sp. DD11]|nr:hypothetical protein STRDD11_02314 [Streptococcus sp. DD11]
MLFHGCFLHALDKGQIAQAQKVHFQQTVAFDTVGIILGDQHVFAVFEGDMVGQIIVAHDDAGRMDRGLARIAFDFLGNVKGLLVFGLAVDNLAKGHVLLISRGQTVSKSDFSGDIGQLILGQAVPLKHIANGLLGPKGRVGDNLSRMPAAVAVTDIADKLRPVDIRNVNINIRHGIALQIEKALKKQVFLHWVNTGNFQCIGHQTADCRPPAHAHIVALTAAETQQIPNDEKIIIKAHLVNDSQLLLQPIRILRPVQAALEKTGLGPLPQLLGCRPLRIKAGQFQFCIDIIMDFSDKLFQIAQAFRKALLKSCRQSLGRQQQLMAGRAARLPQADIVPDGPQHLQRLQLSCMEITDCMQGQGRPLKALSGRVRKDTDIKILSQIQVFHTGKSWYNQSQALKQMLEILPVFAAGHLAGGDLHQIAVALTVQSQKPDIQLLPLSDDRQLQAQKRLNALCCRCFQKMIGTIEIVHIHHAQAAVAQLLGFLHVFFDRDETVHKSINRLGI